VCTLLIIGWVIYHVRDPNKINLRILPEGTKNPKTTKEHGFRRASPSLTLKKHRARAII